MTDLMLIGEEKKGSGSGSARALRSEGKIPAVIYGFNENHMISLVYKDFLKEYQKGNLLSKLLDIKFGKKTLKVIPREVQTDPVTDNPIHVDFQLIKEDVPIKVAVRVKVTNQDKLVTWKKNIFPKRPGIGDFDAKSFYKILGKKAKNFIRCNKY